MDSGTELIPAEVGLPVLGLYVSNGTIGWTAAVLIGFIGSLMGATLFYFLGRYAGRPILVRYGKWLMIKEREIVQGERIVSKYGSMVCIVRPFLPGRSFGRLHSVRIVQLVFQTIRPRLEHWFVPGFVFLCLAGRKVWGGTGRVHAEGA